MILYRLPRDLSVVLFSLALVTAPSLAAGKLPDSATTASYSAAESSDSRLNGAYKFNEGGWTYVHLQGTPEQVGLQHGYLLAREIEDNVRVYMVTAPNQDKRPWSFFRDAAETVLWPHIDPEYQAELKGIAEGLQAQGSKLDLWDIVALNGDIELSNYYLPTVNKAEGKPNPPAAVAPGKCSAFIATGSATKDGKIVIAHSNWSSYAEGERWTVVFDIVPDRGLHILMDGLPGVITSQDDFGVNAAGLMITETTLPMVTGFDVNAIPEFERSRKAMQYAKSIDEYAAIMREGNNGGYANSWLIGDRKTGEIGYLELGLHQTPLTKKKDGYFVSSNFAADPALIRD
ncbi:MAG: C45 family peptidase, partial [Terracidiphilus sp.]